MHLYFFAVGLCKLHVDLMKAVW